MDADARTDADVRTDMDACIDADACVDRNARAHARTLSYDFCCKLLPHLASPRCVALRLLRWNSMFTSLLHSHSYLCGNRSSPWLTFAQVGAAIEARLPLSGFRPKNKRVHNSVLQIKIPKHAYRNCCGLATIAICSRLPPSLGNQLMIYSSLVKENRILHWQHNSLYQRRDDCGRLI